MRGMLVLLSSLLLMSMPIIIPNGIEKMNNENKIIEDAFFKGKPCYCN
jgi:hypothetical protein